VYNIINYRKHLFYFFFFLTRVLLIFSLPFSIYLICFFRVVFCFLCVRGYLANTHSIVCRGIPPFIILIHSYVLYLPILCYYDIILFDRECVHTHTGTRMSCIYIYVYITYTYLGYMIYWNGFRLPPVCVCVCVCVCIICEKRVTGQKNCLGTVYATFNMKHRSTCRVYPCSGTYHICHIHIYTYHTIYTCHLLYINIYNIRI